MVIDRENITNRLLGMSIFLAALICILFQGPGLLQNVIKGAFAGLIAFVGFFFGVKTPLWVAVAIAVIMFLVIISSISEKESEEEPAPSKTDEVSS